MRAEHRSSRRLTAREALQPLERLPLEPSTPGHNGWPFLAPSATRTRNVWTKIGLRLPTPNSPCKAETPVLARVSVHGRYWARTSDPQLVELVLSQLS